MSSCIWKPAPSVPQRGQEAHFKDASKAAHLKDPRKAWQMTRTGPHHLLASSSFSLISISLLPLSPLGMQVS